MTASQPDAAQAGSAPARKTASGKTASLCIGSPYARNAQIDRGLAHVELRQEPGAGVFPIALDRGDGDAQNIGDLLFGKAAEVTHVDNGGGPGVELLQACESVVDFGNAAVEGDLVVARLLQRDMHLTPAAFQTLAAPRMIDNQPA